MAKKLVYQCGILQPIQSDKSKKSVVSNLSRGTDPAESVD